MKNWSWLAVAVLILFGVGGCAFFRNSYRGTERYELTVTQPAGRSVAAGEGNIVVQAFRNLSSAGRKMAYRDGAGQLVDDPYTDWAQSPERMIQCALTGYFAGMRAPETVRGTEISGSIWLFSLDWKEKKARLGISYEIRCRQDNEREVKKLHGSLQFEAPLDARSGAAAAAAMSNCVSQLAAALEDKIEHLK